MTERLLLGFPRGRHSGLKILLHRDENWQLSCFLLRKSCRADRASFISTVMTQSRKFLFCTRVIWCLKHDSHLTRAVGVVFIPLQLSDGSASPPVVMAVTKVWRQEMYVGESSNNSTYDYLKGFAPGVFLPSFSSGLMLLTTASFRMQWVEVLT